MTDPIKTLEALRLTPVDGGAVAWNNALEAAREAFEKNGMYGPFTPITVSGRSEPIDEADMRCAECDCESSNQPETTGNVPEVILDPRAYFEFTTKTVCVDACIAKQIEALWRAGVWTRGCCCGHNKCSPEVFLDRAADAKIAAEVLSRDPREWRLMVWAGDTHHKPASRALEGAVVGVKVKPLVWDGLKADTPFCTYQVTEVDDEHWRWSRSEYPYHYESDPEYQFPEDAKAAAQADYKRRILAALEPTPTLAEAYRAGLEAAAEKAEFCVEHPEGKTVYDRKYAIGYRIRALPVPPEFDRTTVSEFGGE